jgi:hypothetical protein
MLEGIVKNPVQAVVLAMGLYAFLHHLRPFIDGRDLRFPSEERGGYVLRGADLVDYRENREEAERRLKEHGERGGLGLPWVLRGHPRALEMVGKVDWGSAASIPSLFQNATVRNVLSKSWFGNAFVYVDGSRPMTSWWKRSRGPLPYEQTPNASIAEFLASSARGEDVYVSEVTGNHPRLKAVYDLAPFIPAGGGVAGASQGLNLWLASRGVVAGCHFDSADNVFLQLHGNKSFVLFPPDEWPILSLYPRLHPLTRQTKVDIDSPRCDLFPEYCSHAVRYARIAVLAPGDVLFLPAFWFHHVRSESFLSASVSVYTAHAPDKQAFTEVFKHPLPLDAAWSRGLRAASLVRYLDQILQKLCELSERRCFALPQLASAILSARYNHYKDPNYKDPVLDIPSSSGTFECPAPGQQSMDGFGSPHIQRLHRAAVALVAKKFAETSIRATSLLLADYVEEVAKIATMPDMAAVPVFIECLKVEGV